jgi:P27 family predicted phage terminase small subunit
MRRTNENTKKAKGTVKNRVSKAIIDFKPVDDVKAPDELSEEAKVIWNEIATSISDDKMLTVVDRRLLMSYCNEMAKYWKYTKDLQTEDLILKLKNGKGDVLNYMKNPKVDLADRAIANAHKLGMHFGLTPLSRTKIPGSKKKEKSPEQMAKDKLAFLRSKSNQHLKIA